MWTNICIENSQHLLSYYCNLQHVTGGTLQFKWRQLAIIWTTFAVFSNKTL